MPARFTASLVFIACGACTTVTTLGSARTLDEGQGEFAFGAGAQVLNVRGGTTPVQTLEGGVRYAVDDGIEPGLRFSLSGANPEAATDLKVAILRPARNRSGVALSVAPGAAFSLLGSSVRLPLLIGLIDDEGSETVLGVKPALALNGFPPSQSVTPTPYLGASLGRIVRTSPYWAVIWELGGYGTYRPRNGPEPSEWVAAAQVGVGILIDPNPGTVPAGHSLVPSSAPARDDRPPAPAPPSPSEPGEGWW